MVILGAASGSYELGSNPSVFSHAGFFSGLNDFLIFDLG
jgi:hypothetical protein